MNKKSWKAALAASILSLLGTTSVRAGLLSSEVNVGAYFAGDFTGAEISFTADGLPHGFQPYSVDYFFVVLDDKIIMDYSSGTYPNRWRTQECRLIETASLFGTATFLAL